MIQNRYDAILDIRASFLQQLIANSDFQMVKNKLYSKNWKDWHILMAIDNLIINYQMKQLKIRTPNEMNNFIKNIKKYAKNTNIPLDLFNEQNLIQTLQGSYMSTLKNLGFSFPKIGLEIQKIEKFLKEKYNYFEDDVSHKNIFEI